MSLYYSDDMVTVHLGDCLDVLKTMPDASVDAVVCDPPYELAFMGRAWDASGIAFDSTVWRECWRVLKPGGHLLAFGGTRTYHRLAVAIEDAGFEIRDSLHWIYGSGFPKGQDIAKSIDKRREDRTEILRVTAWLAAARDAAGWTTKQVDGLFGFNGMASHWTAMANKAASVPTPEQWDRLRDEMGFDDPEIRPLVATLHGRKGLVGEAWLTAEILGEHASALPGLPGARFDARDNLRRAVSSDAARQWEGWNTALKPAHEPIVLARKSTGFNTTVANVLEHGTGALNIDACRTLGRVPTVPQSKFSGSNNNIRTGGRSGELSEAHPAGRWPTNLVFTHSASCVDPSPCAPDCPVAELDRQSGTRVSGSRKAGTYGLMGYMGAEAAPMPAIEGDQGGASRFFPVFRYEAKAPTSERPKLADGTAHATVKPLALIRWLTRLVTPPGGVVLDPFAGSGTTGEAAIVEGFSAVLIEQDPAHAELIKARLSKPIQPNLFGEVSP